ncbi:MAG: putative toxin-antitoxin system toxin component, PIN family [Trueperaceae bacterium]|nr:MAG: putative toxin-antitoxin system toxin component, PIN family [Trueperaceae bacterium]
MGSQALTSRYVFDTNVVVSVLVFRGESLAWLRTAWATGRVTPVVSRATTTELTSVLAYPKFALDGFERTELLADYLPFAQLVTDPVPRAPVRAVDPDDQPFVDLCVASGAQGLVTGDARLLTLAPTVPVITPGVLSERMR